MPSRTLLRYHLELYWGDFGIHPLPAKEHLRKGVADEASAAPVLKVTAGEVAAALNVMSKEVKVPVSMTGKEVAKEVPASVTSVEVAKEVTVVPDSKVTKKESLEVVSTEVTIKVEPLVSPSDVASKKSLKVTSKRFHNAEDDMKNMKKKTKVQGNKTVETKETGHG